MSTVSGTFLTCVCTSLFRQSHMGTLSRSLVLSIGVIPFFPVFLPTNSSCFGLPQLLSLSPQFTLSWPCCSLSLVLCRGNLSPGSNLGKYRRAPFIYFPSLWSPFYTACCPMSENLFSYIFSKFLVVSGGKVNPGPVTPSGLRTVVFIFLSFIFNTWLHWEGIVGFSWIVSGDTGHPCLTWLQRESFIFAMHCTCFLFLPFSLPPSGIKKKN